MNSGVAVEVKAEAEVMREREEDTEEADSMEETEGGLDTRVLCREPLTRSQTGNIKSH